MTDPRTITTRFGLLRHAETEWNRQKRIQGHSDSPLTLEGKVWAEQWGLRLKAFSFNRIITNNLKRAEETAETINRHLKLPLAGESGFREQYWGLWEGLPISELETRQTFKAAVSAGWHFRPRDGESREEVWQRTREALIQTADRWPGETILLVTHAGVIRGILYRLLGRKYLPEEARVLKSRHLHWLICTNGELSIDVINAVSLSNTNGQADNPG